MNITDKETALAYWGKFLLSPHVNKTTTGFKPLLIDSKTNFSIQLTLKKNDVSVSIITLSRSVSGAYNIIFNGQAFELTKDEYDTLYTIYSELYQIVNVTDIDKYL